MIMHGDHDHNDHLMIIMITSICQKRRRQTKHGKRFDRPMDPLDCGIDA
jgi:hypothetical protein